MTLDRPPSEAARNLAHLKRLRDTVLTLSQDQLDAVGWLAGFAGTTPQDIAAEYGPYIARLQAAVDAERREQDRLMEDLGRLREEVGQ